MITRYVYVSTATNMDPGILHGIGLSSQNYNKTHNVTGILIQIENEYMQIIEGPEKVVKTLYEKIEHDPRHKWVTLIHTEKTFKRTFGEWNMAVANIQKKNLPDNIFLNNNWENIRLQMKNTAFSKKFTGFFEAFYAQYIESGKYCVLIKD